MATETVKTLEGRELELIKVAVQQAAVAKNESDRATALSNQMQQQVQALVEIAVGEDSNGCHLDMETGIVSREKPKKKRRATTKGTTPKSNSRVKKEMGQADGK